LIPVLFEKLFLDLVDPFLVPGVVVFEAIVVLIEAVVIFFLLERSLGKALLASLIANLVTGALSVIYLLFSWEALSTYTRFGFMLIVALVVNIVVETIVLKILFFRATKLSRLIGVSVVMNLASYAIVILYFLYLFATQLASTA
jgi:hypothetical protein